MWTVLLFWFVTQKISSVFVVTLWTPHQPQPDKTFFFYIVWVYLFDYSFSLQFCFVAHHLWWVFFLASKETSFFFYLCYYFKWQVTIPPTFSLPFLEFWSGTTESNGNISHTATEPKRKKVSWGRCPGPVQLILENNIRWSYMYFCLLYLSDCPVPDSFHSHTFKLKMKKKKKKEKRKIKSERNNEQNIKTCTLVS